jgi:hypothetical protein
MRGLGRVSHPWICACKLPENRTIPMSVQNQHQNEQGLRKVWHMPPQNLTLFHQGLNIISPGTHFFLRFEGSELTFFFVVKEIRPGIQHQCYWLQINIVHVELVLWTL